MSQTYYCTSCLTTFTSNVEGCPNLSCNSQRPDGGWGNVLGEGDLLDRHYSIIRPLAIGGAGLTYLAVEINSENEEVGPKLAIKVLYTQRDAGPFLRRLSNEAQILQDLDHENIVQCRGFVHRAGHAPYLVTLFEEGGSLYGHIKKTGALSPVVAAGIIKQILLALQVAHEHGVIHRDLKPENVLLNQPCGLDDIPLVRVADFGIAKVFGGVGNRLTRHGTFIGTPEYAAPEQFEGMAPTSATDLWASGAVLTFLVTGKAPYHFKHRMDVAASYEQLLDEGAPKLSSLPTDAHQTIQNLIGHMMKTEAGDRWTTQQVLAVLDQLTAGHAPQLEVPIPSVIPTKLKNDAPGTMWLDDSVAEQVEVTEKHKEKATKQESTKDRQPQVPAQPDGADGEPPHPVNVQAPKRSATLVLGGGLLLLMLLVVVVVVGAGIALHRSGFGQAPPPTVEETTKTTSKQTQPAHPMSGAVDLDSETSEEALAQRDQVIAIVNSKASAIKSQCHAKGDINLSLTITKEGKLAGKIINTSANAKIGRCAARVLRDTHFGNTMGATIKLNYTLKL